MGLNPERRASAAFLRAKWPKQPSDFGYKNTDYPALNSKREVKRRPI